MSNTTDSNATKVNNGVNVQALLDAPPPVRRYKPGSWGPTGADTLLAGHPGWRYPWLHQHLH